MKAQVKDFAASAREADFTIKTRDRDGKHSVAAQLFDAPLTKKEISQLVAIAFNHNLDLVVRSEGTWTNFDVALAGSKPAQSTNVTIQTDANGRLPGWAWNLVKQTRSITRSRDATRLALDNNVVGGFECDLLEEQLKCVETLLVVLLKRINFYSLASYL